MSNAAPVFVAYYRVSTQQQGASGLGLDAQRAAIAQHVAGRGGELVAEFEEIESGKRKDRPQLRAAIQTAKQRNAVLVIAKLDRLARNVAFLSALMESGVEFAALDLPGANRFTLHIMAAVAEQEARATSERTKAALQAAKARGVKLGSPVPMSEDVRRAGRAARTAQTRERYALAATIAGLMRQQGASFAAIAAKLNTMHAQLQPVRGNQWHPSQVMRILRYTEREQATA